MLINLYFSLFLLLNIYQTADVLKESPEIGSATYHKEIEIFTAFLDVIALSCSWVYVNQYLQAALLFPCLTRDSNKECLLEA